MIETYRIPNFVVFRKEFLFFSSKNWMWKTFLPLPLQTSLLTQKKIEICRIQETYLYSGWGSHLNNYLTSKAVRTANWN
jgi:hypothetical protein